MNSDLRTLRDALIPAVERDLARPRRRRRFAVPLAVLATAVAGTGVATATGVLFADPKPDPAVPNVAEWQYLSFPPFNADGSGDPVMMRPKPEALARTQRALERELGELGVVAQCGADKGHPLACYDTAGELVDGDAHARAYTALEGNEVLESSRDHYEIRPARPDERR